MSVGILKEAIIFSRNRIQIISLEMWGAVLVKRNWALNLYRVVSREILWEENTTGVSVISFIFTSRT